MFNSDKHHFFSIGDRRSNTTGQAMILAVMVLGGAIMGATTIAGMITTYQIRRTTDAANSQKAIFAADAGIECGMYKYFKSGTCEENYTLTNGASYQITIDSGAQTVLSRGLSATARRAFLLYLGGIR